MRKQKNSDQASAHDSHSKHSDLDETFRFDSTMLKGKQSHLKSSNFQKNPNNSKSKNKMMDSLWEKSDFSHQTSQLVRFIDDRNSNILEMLEQSQDPKTANKIDDDEHKELWDFFGRFERQTNPSVSLTQLNFSKEKKKKKQEKKIIKPVRTMHSEMNVYEQEKLEKIEVSDQSYYPEESYLVGNEIRRYPKRNRIKPLRYWLNQKPIYKSGQLIGITSIIDQNQKRRHQK